LDVVYLYHQQRNYSQSKFQSKMNIIFETTDAKRKNEFTLNGNVLAGSGPNTSIEKVKVDAEKAAKQIEDRDLEGLREWFY